MSHFGEGGRYIESLHSRNNTIDTVRIFGTEVCTA